MMLTDDVHSKYGILNQVYFGPNFVFFGRAFGGFSKCFFVNFASSANLYERCAPLDNSNKYEIFLIAECPKSTNMFIFLAAKS